MTLCLPTVPAPPRGTVALREGEANEEGGVNTDRALFLLIVCALQNPQCTVLKITGHNGSISNGF